MILVILSSYPEITTPAWPWWPPQYEHCTRLLEHMSKKFSLSLEGLLRHPHLKQAPGPVLWIGILEAKGAQEGLLRQGLELPWATVRYAAAMALATSGRSLCEETLEVLRRHQQESEEDAIRLSVSYALLANGERIGLEPLLQLINPQAPGEVRKAALFVLSTDLPDGLSAAERTRVSMCLLPALGDRNREIAFHAAHTLSRIAQPALISELSNLLEEPDPQFQIIILSTLEEMAQRADVRRKMRSTSLPARLLSFLQSEISELRRQASCTLAVCGGEFAIAALGTLVLQNDHPAHIEALESVRLLHGALQTKTRLVVVHWLLCALHDEQEEVQITALDSLAFLLWQAHIQHRKQAWNEICEEIIRDGNLFNLLRDKSAWVRQRTIELLSLFDEHIVGTHGIQEQILALLQDPDNGVRACTAFVCGQIHARWAIAGLLLTLNDSDEFVAETALNTLAQIMAPDDSIIHYVIKELAGFNNPRLQASGHLNQAALNLLKQKQKNKRHARQGLLVYQKVLKG
jgi:HEAT repeat protein